MKTVCDLLRVPRLCSQQQLRGDSKRDSDGNTAGGSGNLEGVRLFDRLLFLLFGLLLLELFRLLLLLGLGLLSLGDSFRLLLGLGFLFSVRLGRLLLLLLLLLLFLLLSLQKLLFLLRTAFRLGGLGSLLLLVGFGKGVRKCRVVLLHSLLVFLRRCLGSFARLLLLVDLGSVLRDELVPLLVRSDLLALLYGLLGRGLRGSFFRLLHGFFGHLLFGLLAAALAAFCARGETELREGK